MKDTHVNLTDDIILWKLILCLTSHNIETFR